jgi:pilus assembly protein CpaB
MTRRLLNILILALVLATACSFLVYRLVGKRISQSTHITITPVVAASGDIKLGSILTPASLKVIQIAGPLPKGAILKPENAIGRGVTSDLYQGEPIIESRLAPVGSGGGLAATIRQGMRACAVKVDEVVGVAGFVTPGMRVDVLISGDPPGEPNPREGSRVKTLLQNIEVLSAGTDIQKDAEGKPLQVHVVNLLVSPGQAEALSLASNHTQIQLDLRNPLDTKVAEVNGFAMANLFGDNHSAPAAEPAPARKLAHHSAPRTVSIEILNGAQHSEQHFPASSQKE